LISMLGPYPSFKGPKISTVLAHLITQAYRTTVHRHSIQENNIDNDNVTLRQSQGIKLKSKTES